MECTKLNCPMQVGTVTENCGDNCPWRTTVKLADLISRAAAVRIIADMHGLCRDDVLCESIQSIKELPAVDAALVVHGRWVKMTGMMPPEYHGHYECSECQWHMKGLRNSWTREEELYYCPHCGAKMDGEADG